jgi:hypothetical protein
MWLNSRPKLASRVMSGLRPVATGLRTSLEVQLKDNPRPSAAHINSNGPWIRRCPFGHKAAFTSTAGLLPGFNAEMGVADGQGDVVRR